MLTVFTCAVGLTVIVKLRGVPLHVNPPLVYTGVIVIVAVTGAVPVLTAVKLAMSPVPLAPSPIVVLLFVQLYTIVPPVVGELNVIAAVLPPLHTTWLDTALTVAVGFTIIVKLRGVPLQVMLPLVYAGVTVIVAVIGEVPVFTAANEAMSPVPLADNPIEGVSFVHKYVVPATVPPKVTAVVLAPAQTS